MRAALLFCVVLAFALHFIHGQDLPIDQLKINAPPGIKENFKIEVLARVPNARQMASNANGTILFVGSFDAGKVYAVLLEEQIHPFRQTRQLKATQVLTLFSNLTYPSGVAFDSETGDLYVAEIHQITKYSQIEKNLYQPPVGVKIVSNPTDMWHGWKYLRIIKTRDQQKRLVFPIGSPCNTCLEPDRAHGKFYSVNLDGSDRKEIAQGMRNSVGFDQNPNNLDELWWTENGRDEWGDNKPCDELNVIRNISQTTTPLPHFGFPYCYEFSTPDTEYNKNGSCTPFIPAQYCLGPHVAAIGMQFYRNQKFSDTSFPKEVVGASNSVIFIAEHGSWNREIAPIGYRITRVDTRDPSPNSYQVFVDGWLKLDGNDSDKAFGRPSDVMQYRDGALLVSDDKAGAIYKISYQSKSVKKNGIKIL